MDGNYLFPNFPPGPALPKTLQGHSMIENGQEELYVLGGWSSDDDDSGYISKAGYQRAIYRLKCKSGICSWTTMDKQLDLARKSFLAIPIPDSLVNCGNQGTNKTGF